MPNKNRFAKMFALAKEAGMSGEQGNEDLHALVNSVCGKDSLKELTDSDYAAVIKELQIRAGTSDTYQSKCTGNAKGMTKGQEGKIWRLMYELQELSPSSAALGERLCGIIKKEFSIDATSEKPLVWFSYSDASKMIEILKRYVSSAEKKIAKGGTNGTGNKN